MCFMGNKAAGIMSLLNKAVYLSISGLHERHALHNLTCIDLLLPISTVYVCIYNITSIDFFFTEKICILYSCTE